MLVLFLGGRRRGSHWVAECMNHGFHLYCHVMFSRKRLGSRDKGGSCTMALVVSSLVVFQNRVGRLVRQPPLCNELFFVHFMTTR